VEFRGFPSDLWLSYHPLSVDHYRDDALQGGGIGEQVAVDEEEVGIQARVEPALACGECAVPGRDRSG
jgi:hypothetical protein